MKKTIWLFIFVFIFHSNCFTQCMAIRPFTQKAMAEIHDVYQFNFLHATPVNKLDSLVKQALNPLILLDSNYYNWTNTASMKLGDKINMPKIVDAIGALQTKEAFVILNLYYMLPFKMEDDLSPFVSLCSNIHFGGATKALNKYFLSNAVSSKLSAMAFDNAVIAKAVLLRKKYFVNITYCQPLIGDAKILFDMQQYNPNYYDSIIENKITTYLNHYANVPGYFELDSVMIAILQMPFVHDAQWDNCVPKLASDTYSPPLQLGVIIQVGMDENNQKIYIQRVYAIGKDAKRNSVLLPATFSANFVSITRNQCAGIDEEIELK